MPFSLLNGNTQPHDFLWFLWQFSLSLFCSSFPFNDDNTDACLPDFLDLFFFFFLLTAAPAACGSPGLGVELELHLQAYTTAAAMPDPRRICKLHRSLQQRWILNLLSKARDWTHILLDTKSGSQPAEPQQELPRPSLCIILWILPDDLIHMVTTVSLSWF